MALQAATESYTHTHTHTHTQSGRTGRRVMMDLATRPVGERAAVCSGQTATLGRSAGAACSLDARAASAGMVPVRFGPARPGDTAAGRRCGESALASCRQTYRENWGRLAADRWLTDG